MTLYDFFEKHYSDLVILILIITILSFYLISKIGDN